MRVSHAGRALRIVWQATPLLSAISIGLTLVRGLLPGATVYTMKWLVDSVDSVIGVGLSMDTVLAAAVPAVVMAVLVLMQQGLSSGSGYLDVAQSEIVQDHFKAIIHEKAIGVDYALYESEEYYNKLRDAHAQAATRSLGLFRNLTTLISSAIAFLTITLILMTYAWWLPLALFGGAAPGLMLIVHHNRLYRRWWDKTMTTRRRADYFDHVTVMDTFAAEVRLFGFGRTITSAYQAVRKDLREGRLRIARRESIVRIIAAAIGLVGLGVLMVWMLYEALEGRATIGDLALFYQSINQGQGIVRGLLGGVSGFYTNALFLEQLFSLLDIESRQVKSSGIAPVPTRVASGVEFEDVWFTYPGGSRPSLKGLNIVLPADRISAIVGANGAGKSTLLKLMCRFYEVDRGRILIDGVDISSMERDEIYKAISVLFQSPVKHQDTAWANISLSNSEASKEEIIEAARLAGAHDFIDKLPRGFDSVLGKYFYEGAELSGGQWQRVALARAYLRNAPIMVLDEPTSAMDSWSEMEWFERFRHLARGKVAAIITHRFTVAMQADRIFVMDDGRIVEEGTHRELLHLNGVYASSWKEQMRRAERAERSPSVPSHTASGVA